MLALPTRSVADFKLLALTSVGVSNPAVAIAASRAGETGVLNLEYAEGDFESVLRAFESLATHARGECGVRLSGDDPEFVAKIIRRLPDYVRFVVVTSTDNPALASSVQMLRDAGLQIVLEATSIDDLDTGRHFDVDAFLVKGHEAGGRCGDETAFILAQRFARSCKKPFYIQGGIGLHTIAASYAAGAAGVVLSDQLALARESVLPKFVRDTISRMDGSETAVLGERTGYNVRVYRGVGSGKVQQMSEREEAASGDEIASDDWIASWSRVLKNSIGWGEDRNEWIWPLGQDACFASTLEKRFKTVGGILQALRKAISADVKRAVAQQSLSAHGALATAHGTEFPIVQGPMTRVSDTVDFAESVSEGGALPFLALALMPGEEAASLLSDAAERLDGCSWGVGILGFVPSELRTEQLDALLAHPPTHALIAGGRPDQARLLEEAGIPTYLHVPSPGLLRLFAEQGTRRFVFEGRECGGHVGPRTSFVLWNTMIETLLEELSAAQLAECQLLFAGGIHDALSASMIACMAAPLVEKGASIGVLMGTAYLFTEEAIAAGAIAEGFQQEAITADRTVLLHTAPGHATRCARTPFVDLFEKQKAALIRQGISHDETAQALERLNIGRLRVASKGIDRNPEYGNRDGVDKFVSVDEAGQHAAGMYMMGQLAALRSERCTVRSLHEDVIAGGGYGIRSLAGGLEEREPQAVNETPSDIAIVGMSCLLPGAPDLSTYRSNIVNKIDAITEVPPDRWDWQAYFDEDPKARDKVYSKWGGYLDDVLFDPMRYGMPPSSLPSIEPLQLLTLEAVRAALEDAGYLDREYDKEHVSVILGVGGGTGDLGQQYAVRSGLPALFEDADPRVWDELPEWTEDSFAGILLNVAAGRVANRFDFGGVNYTVDAACASSLAAVYHAVRELEAGTSDMVIVGGADTVQNPFGYLCFSKTQALSPRGRCHTFDESADGIVISEGIALLVLKRLADAERDGDRIYAVIKGVAGSSDGRDKGLTAPRPAGQVRALERAYRKAGFSPATVGLIEAHGTGTVAGDQAEIESLMTVFGQAGAGLQSCAVGSVKSMIGHTKCAAGVAGLIKIALALRDRVLPPTMHVEQPNTKARFHESAFYVNTEARPWPAAPDSTPRRAGVSAFGFGGTNFHAVLEEYTGDLGPDPALQQAPAELLFWRGSSRNEIAGSLESMQRQLADGIRPNLSDLAFSLWEIAKSQAGELTLALICVDLEDLSRKLAYSVEALRNVSLQSIDDPRGIYFEEQPLARNGKMAFLFPGQGSQYPTMLQDLVVSYAEVRDCLENADRVLEDRLPARLYDYVYPLPVFTEEEAAMQRERLTDTRIAQPALGMAGAAMGRLMESFGVRADAVAGHSYGEYVALHYAGVFDEKTLYCISEARGRCLAGTDEGAMAAVLAGEQQVSAVIDDLDGVWLANLNSPEQTIISGDREAIEQTVQVFLQRGVDARLIPVSCAFHSPLMEPAIAPWRHELSLIEMARPSIPVYSNETTRPHTDSTESISESLINHVLKPVRFTGEVEQLYADGVRLFVEIGPNAVLSGLVDRTLEGRPHRAVATDRAGRNGVVQLLHALGQLAAHGVAVDLERQFRGRNLKRLNVERLEPPSIPATAWRVNGGYARPYHEPIKRATSASLPGPTRMKDGSVIANGRGDIAAEGTFERGGRDEVEQAMIRHQRIMQQFLESQRNIMMAYLGRSDSVLGAEPDAQPETLPADTAKPPIEEVTENAASELLDGPAIEKNLLRVVSERTGYPEDIIDTRLNLEADLGIDSIKRVEILGAFLREYMPGALPDGFMERLTQQKTIHELVELLSIAANSGQAIGEVERSAAEVGAPLPRFLVEMAPTPLAGDPLNLALEKTILITDDGGGAADKLAQRLMKRGGMPIVLQHGGEFERIDETTYRVDMLDAVSIEACCLQIQNEHGPVAGLCHLLPLRDRREESHQLQLDLDVRSLFHLSKSLHDKLTGGRLLVATSMGGAFGFDGEMSGPLQGSVNGFVKTLRKEIEIRGRIVDFESTIPADEAAERLVDEWESADEEVEIGYIENQRFVVRLRNAPLSRRKRRTLPANPVILVTGGARGITAEIAVEMAQRWRPKLVLVGRSAEPKPAEAEWTAGILDEAALKGRLLEHLRAENEAVAPRDIERAYRATIKEREMRENMERMRNAGASVDYIAVDVSDEEAFEQCLKDLYTHYGRLDGVVHGAGAIDDGLLIDKSMKSFDNVLGVKVKSALTLSNTLDMERLSFLIFFSSVSGRFGNRGQIDYAAANEVLNKLAVALETKSPALVRSVDWGPWGEVGMVSPEVQRSFEARGIPLVAPRSGSEALCDEIQFGVRGEVEIVLGDGPWRAGALPALAFPLLAGMEHMADEGPQREARRLLSIRQDVFLEDHRLDGKPVFPTAFALEWMLEFVRSEHPPGTFIQVRDFSVLQGIIIDDNLRDVKISVAPAGEGRLEATIYDFAQKRVCFRAILVPGAPAFASPEINTFEKPLNPFPMSVGEAYSKWLFHGPRFEGIKSIEGINDEGMRAWLKPSMPKDLLRETFAKDWQLDPIVIDSALQMAILWIRATEDMTPLPAGFERLVQYAPLDAERIRCDMRASIQAGGHMLRVDYVFFDDTGLTLAVLEGMEFSCSRALNRLGGQTRKEAETA